MSASALCGLDLPRMLATPYSVTMYWVSARGSVAGPSIWGTMRETVPPAAVE
jgi:hypothetical protein